MAEHAQDVSYGPLKALLFLWVLACPTHLAAQGSAAPEVTAVVGAADNNPGISRGGLITIYGSNFASSNARANSFPLAAVLNGVRVHLCCTASQTSFDALPISVSPYQLNALMPSAVPEGAYQVTVVANAAASAPFSINVITARFAAFSQSWLGYGWPLLEQYEGPGPLHANRFLHPAHPGQAVVLWGTGLGPLPASASDTEPPPVANIRNDVVVYIAGIAVQPFYAGRTPGAAGVDQINFFLPKNAPEGCMVPFAVRAAGYDTLTLTMAISSNSSACTSEFGLPQAALSKLDQGGTVRLAVLNFSSETDVGSAGVLQQMAEAWIADYTASTMSLLTRTFIPAADFQSEAPPVDFLSDAVGQACSFRELNIPPFTAFPQAYPDYHGLLPGTRLTLEITGSSGSTGCSWPIVSDLPYYSVEGGTSAGCTASGFSLSVPIVGQQPFSATGALPAARPASSIANFVVQQSGGGWEASWQAGGAGANDLLVLDGQSSFQFSMCGACPGPTDVPELACRTTVQQGSYTFPQPDIDNALRLLNDRRASLEWTHSTIRGVAPSSSSPFDFLLIRTQSTIATVDQLN